MSNDELAAVPLVQRLALSYAPAASRDAVLTLLLLDNRLATVLRQRGENVLIAQMKLAWWRDRLGQTPQDWPKGEPLLQRLREWPGAVAGLVPLVNGWENLLSEQLDRAAMLEFAKGRGMAWRALAAGLDLSGGSAEVDMAAQDWAIFDLAQHLGMDDERKIALAEAQSRPMEKLRLGRKLRPLAVLHGLTRRAMERGSDELLDGPGAMLTALQLGIFGR